MFHYASAFDQDLNWCVDNDVNLDEAFSGTPCASTSCGIVRGRSEGGICVTLAPTFFDGAFGDESIRTAVRAWAEDRAAAEATYGHISTWETSGVTDMSWLFLRRGQDWMEGHSTRTWADNSVGQRSPSTTMEWDTCNGDSCSGTPRPSTRTSARGTLRTCTSSTFDQDITGTMFWMFNASSFNQNIGGWNVETSMR